MQFATPLTVRCRRLGIDLFKLPSRFAVAQAESIVGRRVDTPLLTAGTVTSQAAIEHDIAGYEVLMALSHRIAVRSARRDIGAEFLKPCFQLIRHRGPIPPSKI